MAEYNLFLHVASRQSDPARLFEEICSEAQLAEAVGFSGCFIGEHHQSLEGHFGAPLIWCAAIASRTNRIRIGTSVLLLPLYHPVHVAEDAATIDVISGGRFILGLGLGYQDADFAAFDVPARQRVSRMEEGIEIIRRAWTEEGFSFHGKRFDLDDVNVVPKPLQKPHPPIWIAGMSEQGVRRAALQGNALLADPLRNLADLRPLVSLYRDLTHRNGRTGCVALRRDAWVAPTAQQAAAEYGSAVRSMERFVFGGGVARELPQEVGNGRGSSEGGTAEDRLILGSPSDCIELLRRYEEELGVDHFSLRFRHPGGPPHEQVMRAIRMFGEQVIQRL